MHLYNDRWSVCLYMSLYPSSYARYGGGSRRFRKWFVSIFDSLHLSCQCPWIHISINRPTNLSIPKRHCIHPPSTCFPSQSVGIVFSHLSLEMEKEMRWNRDRDSASPRPSAAGLVWILLLIIRKAAVCFPFIAVFFGASPPKRQEGFVGFS